MNASLTQQYPVKEEGQLIKDCKLFLAAIIMMSAAEKAPGNSVPAAAVRQGGQVLFLLNRRKGLVGFLTS